MKVALVHDYLTQYGGAERVLEELHAIWPDAPIYTSLFEPAKMPPAFRSWDIKASFLDRIPMARRSHQALLFVLPQAFESFDLDQYDLVVSSSSGFAHGVLTGPQTLHLCYCHSPPRFLWDYHNYARREGLGRAARLLVESRLPGLRAWDRVAADRPDIFIATSRLVRSRIARFYGRSSVIIPPPVPTSRFEVGRGQGGYFLMLMRLVAWKQPAIVVEACTRLGLPLVVGGDGRQDGELRRLAGPTVRFVGRANDAQIRLLYRDCKALILPSEEDFGITPLEAMASGRPVIAFGRGGVLDTVAPGRSGVFFDEQTPEALMRVLSDFDEQRFEADVIRRSAEAFDSAVFAQRVRGFAASALGRHFARRESETRALVDAALPPAAFAQAAPLAAYSGEDANGMSLWKNASREDTPSLP